MMYCISGDIRQESSLPLLCMTITASSTLLLEVDITVSPVSLLLVHLLLLPLLAQVCSISAINRQGAPLPLGMRTTIFDASRGGAVGAGRTCTLPCMACLCTLHRPSWIAEVRFLGLFHTAPVTVTDSVSASATGTSPATTITPTAPAAAIATVIPTLPSVTITPTALLLLMPFHWLLRVGLGMLVIMRAAAFHAGICLLHAAAAAVRKAAWVPSGSDCPTLTLQGRNPTVGL
jgi:hypothetical protein